MDRQWRTALRAAAEPDRSAKQHADRRNPLREPNLPQRGGYHGMRQILGYGFVALALVSLLFNAYLNFVYCKRGRGSSPVSLFVAVFGTLAVLCFKGSDFGATSYVVIFVGLFIFSVLTALPAAYVCHKRGILKGPSIFRSRNEDKSKESEP
jgi:FtsH-binding integral membrane protein